MLPTDDYILLSLVNTYLRDGGSLADFCAERDVDEDDVLRRLAAAGFTYDGENNAFKIV